MTKQAYKSVNLRSDSLELVRRCNEIIEEYLAQNLRLTLRQLYYQLVTKNIIRNEEKQYKRLSSIVSDGRLGGLMDWNAIEDRVRQPRMPPEYDNLQDLVDSALYSYRLPRWEGQPNYVELWVEKDALAGVLQPIARRFHVTMMVNRGYSSQSAMYESGNRFIRYCIKPICEDEELKDCPGSVSRKQVEDNDWRFVEPEDDENPPVAIVRQPILLYLGDHDPSGEDMVRDVRERLQMFGVHEIEVYKIALTMDQVQQYNPPPNPAKITDPRAADYIKKYGHESWEVDALPPQVLSKLITENIKEHLDEGMMDEIKEKEKKDKAALKAAVQGIMKPKEGG